MMKWGFPMRMHLVASLGLCAALQVVGCSGIQNAVMERNLDQIAEGNHPEWLRDDAIHVVICGSGAPLLDLERAGPCTAVIAGGKMYLVDVGPGATERALQYRLPLADLDGILLTHFHSDHIAEVGEAMTQSWIAGRALPLDVYGPDGVSDVVAGFAKAYARDQVYRTEHHSEAFMPKAGAQMRAHAVMPGPEQDAKVFERNGLKVFAIQVDHTPVAPAVGYRFEYAGRTIVISGDTDVSSNLGRAANGADLLVHEALSKDLVGRMSAGLAERKLARMSRLASDVLDYHTSPQEALTLAREAGVATLVLTHLVPPVPGMMARRIFLRDLGDRGDTEVVLGADGLHFRIPPEGRIERDDLN